MLRKFALGVVAAVVLGAAALAPTAASARWHGGGGFHHGGFHGGWHGGGFHRGFGPRFFVGGPRYYPGYGGYGGCLVRRLVPTPFGLRYRLVNRCY